MIVSLQLFFLDSQTVSEERKDFVDVQYRESCFCERTTLPYHVLYTFYLTYGRETFIYQNGTKYDAYKYKTNENGK